MEQSSNLEPLEPVAGGVAEDSLSSVPLPLAVADRQKVPPPCHLASTYSICPSTAVPSSSPKGCGGVPEVWQNGLTVGLAQAMGEAGC